MEHPAQQTDALPYQSNETSEHSGVYPTLTTFENSDWPSKHNGKIVKLASIGFFYTGSSDLVRCFHCGLGLGDWEMDDDPRNEHKRLGYGCVYFDKFLKYEPCVYEAKDACSTVSRQLCDRAKCDFCRWELEAKNDLTLNTRNN
uniref:Uncharacterized protein n=1 Tax=Anopheles albimanus TaxID=7167 RepID=A0A182FCA2_ANOAL